MIRRWRQRASTLQVVKKIQGLRTAHTERAACKEAGYLSGSLGKEQPTPVWQPRTYVSLTLSVDTRRLTRPAKKSTVKELYGIGRALYLVKTNKVVSEERVRATPL